MPPFPAPVRSSHRGVGLAAGLELKICTSIARPSLAVCNLVVPVVCAQGQHPHYLNVWKNITINKHEPSIKM